MSPVVERVFVLPLQSQLVLLALCFFTSDVASALVVHNMKPEALKGIVIFSRTCKLYFGCVNLSLTIRWC